MHLHNSLLSVRRSPLKSILFFILIFALTVVVMLGSTLVNTCRNALNLAKESYITTAVLEYQGGAYPNQDIFDDTAIDLQKAIDFDALAELPYIQQAEKTQNAAVYIEGYDNIKAQMPAMTAVVLDVLVGEPNAEGDLLATVKNVLYSVTMQGGRTVILSMPRAADGSAIPFEPESGKRYILCGYSDGRGTGNSMVTVTSILPQAAVAAGYTLDTPIVELTDTSYDESDPRLAPFYTLAEVYTRINNSRYAVLTAEPAMLEEFSQEKYIVKQGGYYTAADCKDGRICCLIPEIIASRLGLSPGDTIDIEIFATDEYPIAGAYYPGVTVSEVLSCYVSGIYGTSTEDVPRIYLSSFGNVPGGLTGFTLGSLRLENGVRTLPDGLLSSDITVTIYDQGFAGVDYALSELMGGALRLLLLAAVVALALLLLFAFLFVSRQAEAIRTMYMLGTSKVALCRYVLYATGSILLPATLLACLVPAQFTKLLGDVLTKSTNVNIITAAFSTTGLSVIKEFSPSVEMPPLLLIGCAAVIALVGLLLSLCFLLPILHTKKQKREKKGKKKDAAPREKKTSMLPGAGRKYLLLSIRRGGVRSLVVPFICLLMAVFLLALSFTEQLYRDQRRALDENTEITGYFSDYSGKLRGNLLLPDRMFTNFRDSNYFSDIVLYSQATYLFLGEVTKPDGTTDFTHQVIIPENSFAYASFIDNFSSGPKIYYTPDLLATGGFAQEGKGSVTWLDGYDESYFTEEREAFSNLHPLYHYYAFDEDLREFCCVVPDAFLEKYNAELGDSIFLLVGVSPDVGNASYKIIGSYEGKTADGSFYTRLDNEPLVMSVWLGWGVHESFDVISLREAYSGGSFRLTDTAKLQEAKDTLDEVGYSRIRQTSRYRVFPIFEDSEYLSNAEKLESSIAFMTRMRIVAMVLTFFCGATAAYLISSRRKTELAVLRSLGTKRSTAFFLFFGEQCLLCLGGTILGLLLWRLVTPWNLQSLFALAFAAGYLPATAIALQRASRADLLSVLSEKE